MAPNENRETKVLEKIGVFEIGRKWGRRRRSQVDLLHDGLLAAVLASVRRVRLGSLAVGRPVVAGAVESCRFVVVA